MKTETQQMGGGMKTNEVKKAATLIRALLKLNDNSGLYKTVTIRQRAFRFLKRMNDDDEQECKMFSKQMTVHNCHRCSGDHGLMLFDKLINSESPSHWAICPTTGQPILITWPPPDMLI